MARPTKLELTWIGKENRPRLEPRILIEDPSKSCHAPFRVSDQDLFDNRLIFGDNLLALKALEQEFAEKIKCIYIDPPYNTGSAFTHYDDGVEHSLWLSLMRDRLEILRHLLAADGSIWISIESFAGSGTTGAVAHKMGRRWIMVELGEHCHTHIIPRLKKVIDGEDKGGITEAVGWKGGGGFRHYRLAPSLLQKDQFENWVINRKYNAAMLAEAICKLEGFVYAPSDTVYWQHGRSTEKDFIYVTTQTLTREQIQKLSDEVGEGRSLLIMCAAFRVKNLDEFSNLTVKKIPKAVLSRCEWGKDNYSLEIRTLPLKPAEDEPEAKQSPSGKKPRTKEERRASVQQSSLFDRPGGKGGGK